MTSKDITYQDKLNELRLDTSHPNSTGLVFILLEGESDIRLFKQPRLPIVQSIMQRPIMWLFVLSLRKLTLRQTV